MNKVSVKILDKINSKETSNDYYFKAKDAALIFVNDKVEAFENQYGKIINSVILDDYYLFKETETHEMLLSIKWSNK